MIEFEYYKKTQKVYNMTVIEYKSYWVLCIDKLITTIN